MSTISTLPTQDLSFYGIPTAFILAMAPHLYCLIKMMQASGGRWSNTYARGNLEYLKDKVPKDIWNRCYRARSAHQNALEVFPLFIAGVLGGRFAGVPIPEMNAMTIQFLGLRVLYTILYIHTNSRRWSYLRSIVYNVGIWLPFWTLIKAGRLINSKISDDA